MYLSMSDLCWVYTVIISLFPGSYNQITLNGGEAVSVVRRPPSPTAHRPTSPRKSRRPSSPGETGPPVSPASDVGFLCRFCLLSRHVPLRD